MSNKVMAVLKPVLVDLGADADPACWVLWGEDAEFRYSIMVPTVAGLISVAVRVTGAGEGPRATGKLVRWGKLQIGEFGIEASDGHRIVAVQVEGQVLKGTDEEADSICEFVRGLLAGIDGRAFQAATPVVVQAVAPSVAVAPVAAVSKPAVEKPEAPKPEAKPAAKPTLISVPAPAQEPAPVPAAAARATKKDAPSAPAQAAPPAADQPPARKPAKTPSGRTSTAWVAPHPIGLPVPPSKALAVQPAPAPTLKVGASKRAAAQAAPPPAATKPAEPAEGSPVWDVPEPTEREAKRPRTWAP
jgi:hypothetical protein